MTEVQIEIKDEIYKVSSSMHTKNHPLSGPDWYTIMVNKIDSSDSVKKFDFYFNIKTNQWEETKESKGNPCLLISAQMTYLVGKGLEQW